MLRVAFSAKRIDRQWTGVGGAGDEWVGKLGADRGEMKLSRSVTPLATYPLIARFRTGSRSNRADGGGMAAQALASSLGHAQGFTQ
jgi:hypothetical protein